LSLIPERILLPLIMWQMGKLVRLCSVPRQRHFEGLSLWQMARARRQEIFEAMLDLLAEEELAVACTVLVMHEADIRRVLQHPNTLIGSDSFPMRGGNPHPRTFGTFARVLGHYVREVSLLGLEQAVHRMTGLAAFVLGLTDRGRLVPGAVADLVVFDPERISDEATLDAPTRPATGIRHVFVAGRQALADGRLTGVRAGRVLRRGEALALK
jgi:N-acyl-D-aspartate/D-glutamate deacylase